MKLIAETAWHHQGDYKFMKNLIEKLSTETNADIIKMHITLDFDEYMDPKHEGYSLLKPWLFTKEQWTELILIVQNSGKEIMLLVNDLEAVAFAKEFNPNYIEVHSVCLNDIFLLDKVKSILDGKMKLVLGVGGTDIEEIDHAINYLSHDNILLMFGFQNYPTVYKDVNLNKIRRIMNLYPKFDYGYADHTAWDSPNNELITLLGAASGMKYIEKHVTTAYGKERVDWNAAISIEMFNKLSQQIKILDDLNGNGLLEMNKGELNYSIFGPMKKAAILKEDLQKGEFLSKEMIMFIRTDSISDISQLEVIQSLGKEISTDMKKGELLMKSSFI